MHVKINTTIYSRPTITFHARHNSGLFISMEYNNIHIYVLSLLIEDSWVQTCYHELYAQHIRLDLHHSSLSNFYGASNRPIHWRTRAHYNDPPAKIVELCGWEINWPFDNNIDLKYLQYKSWWKKIVFRYSLRLKHFLCLWIWTRCSRIPWYVKFFLISKRRSNFTFLNDSKKR